MLSHYPEATYEVHKDADGNPFFRTEAGTFVSTEVTVERITRKEVLCVLDGANKPILDESYTYDTKYKKGLVVPALNTFDINSAYKRCLIVCETLIVYHSPSSLLSVQSTNHSSKSLISVS